ncbi:MAG: hypothetical protein KKB50_10065 [Planctomycetes bacterium]|nr:hypothetical protein [Planctomycetota bacterium]
MPGPLHILHDPPLDGPSNMARDEHLLHTEALRPAALRLYAWMPATISLGYFQQSGQIERLPADMRGLPVVRRQTGGGAILHDCEITYCLVVDDTLDITRESPLALYRLAHGCWRTALEVGGPACALAPESYPMPSPRGGPFFCFEKPGQTDLVVGAEKLLGSAQRRIRGRVLQHGSLLLGRRIASHPGVDLGQPPPELVQAWCVAFVRELAAALKLEPQAATWTAAQLADVERRRRRYSSDEWTKRK